MDAFDADVLIYAVSPSNRFGPVLRATIAETAAISPLGKAGVGSVLLLTETMIKPSRQRNIREATEMANLLARLELHACDRATAELAVGLGSQHGLRSVDAIHLATAVNAGADRFITNNRKDFSKDIEEIDITYPEDLEPSVET